MSLFESIRSSILGPSGAATGKARFVQGDEDDKQLLNKFEQWWQDSQTVYDRRMEWVRRNRNFYKGFHLHGRRANYRSKVVHNKIFENVDSYEANLTKEIPEPVAAVYDSDPALMEAANTVSNALFHINRKDRTQEKMELVVHNMLVDRDAIIVPKWDPKMGKEGDITIEVLQPEYVRLDPNSTPFDKGDYFFIAPPRSYREVLELYPDHKDHIDKSFGIDDLELAKDKKSANLLPLKTVWYWQWNKSEERFDVYFAVYLKDKILDKGINPYWDFEGELSPEDRLLFEQKLTRLEEIAVLEGEDVVKDEMEQLKKQVEEKKKFRNHLENQELPYVMFPTFPSNSEAYSITSFIEQVAPLQVSLNERKQEIDENTKLVGKGQWVIDDDCGVSPNQITSAAGAVYRKKPGTDMRREPGIPIPGHFFNDMADTETAIDNIFGANDISKGVIPPSGTPARTAILAKEADEGRAGKVFRHFKSGLQEMYRWQVHLMRLMYDQPRLISVTNALGHVDSFQTIVNDDIPDQMQIFVETGNSLPKDAEARKTEITNLYREGLIDSITFFERIGTFKDPELQARRLWEEKNNLLFDAHQPGPEDRARQAIEAIKSGETVQPDEQPTEESVRIQVEALRDPTLALTDDQLEKLEEKIQVETSVLKGQSVQRRADFQRDTIPADVAAAVPEAEQSAAVLEELAQKEEELI